MRDIKNKLTSGKNTKNIQTRKGKSFGYQVLGFGAGGAGSPFIEATGGTITTVDTDYKVHTFTGPGTFEVTQTGSVGAGYLIVGGAGSGGTGSQGGGGGAGGYREATTGGYTASPLATDQLIVLPATTYPIVIGGGGSKGSPGPECFNTQGGNSGVASSALGITSAGGGRGASGPGAPRPLGESGGSGGGNNQTTPTTVLAGNTPPVSPPQGFPGGDAPAGSPAGIGAGGGGAGDSRSNQWVGDNGATSSITGSAVILATGGGGGKNSGTGLPADGGPRGGGAGGSSNIAGNSGATGNTDGGDSGTNLGSGGGGGGRQSSVQSRAGGNGGAGVVHIRYKFQ